MAVFLSGGELPQPLPGFNRHQHHEWEMVCYVHGHGVLTCGDQDILFEPGVAVALPPLIPHEERAPDTGFRCIFLSYRDAPSRHPVIGRDHDGGLAQLLRLANGEGRRRGGTDWQQVADDCLSAALRLLRRSATQGRDPLVDRVEALLQAAVPDADFSIATLAEDCGLSGDVLARRFRRLTGQSPRARLTALRMAEARGLLARGLSVGETAALVGFDDPFWFSKQYRRHHGVPPRDMQGGSP